MPEKPAAGGYNDQPPLNSGSVGNARQVFSQKPNAGIQIPGLEGMITQVDKLGASLNKVFDILLKGAEKTSKANKNLKEFSGTVQGAAQAAGGVKGGGGGGSTPVGASTSPNVGSPSIGKPDSAPGKPTVGGSGSDNVTSLIQSARMSGGGGGGGGTTFAGGNPGNSGGVPAGPALAMSNVGTGMAQKALSGDTLGAGIAAAKSFTDILGAISGAGMQYAYNRIEGPTGNRNAMLTSDELLGRQSTMSGLSLDKLTRLLGTSSPVQGSFTDVMTTLNEGSRTGAYLKGSEGRNGYFESVRQMQALTPGTAAGQMAGTLSNYMTNTRSQQMGVFLGGGAFTMMGKGGRYKSLIEWADGITKFFEEQRPGGARGKPFSKEDIMAQNFPGSNINAWFQQMQIPTDMVDYWWQYIMTKAGTSGPGTGPWTTEQLAGAVQNTRGMDISKERLRNVSQSTRREFTMGSQMRGLYGVRESADRRFNVAMEGADNQIAQLMKTTNVGAVMSMLPTPIAELLMPMLQKYASSPVGGIAAAMGGIMGDPIGDTGYGDLGGTSTGHLNPDLASKIKKMQKANPAISITSGYRDTVTQNRLHKAGAGRVGPASKSAHTRGWAADLGPTNQLGWIQANAHKFGLQTASNAREPWHVQLAGTMPESIGDPGAPIGDLGEMVGSVLGAGKDILGSVLGGLPGVSSVINMVSVLTEGLDVFQGMIGKFASGGSLSGMIDNAINMYMKMLLIPLTGQAKLFGQNDFGTNTGAMDAIINRPASLNLELPGFTGLSPSIPGDPYGDYGRMAGASINVGAPVIVNNHITVQGGVSSDVEAKKVAASLVSHMEAQIDARLVRSR